MSVEQVIVTRRGVLTIKLAERSELEDLVAIDASASARVRALGYDPGMPPRPTRDILADRVARGAVYLARLNGAPAGMITLQWEDELWRDLPGEAVYVHGFATHREFAGKEIGAYLLTLAERLGEINGKSSIRLDCNADNLALRAYYERSGFARRGDVARPGRVASRYERPIGG